MIIKNRLEPIELRMLKTLDDRMGLSEKEKMSLVHLQKGFNGEQVFDERIRRLEIENIIINDLLLEVNLTFFQIDSLVITHNTVYLFEVKNYEGEYYYDQEKFKILTGNEIKDPLIQLKRSESLLRQLFTSLGFSIPIQAKLIFVNSEFTLLQAPINQPIILPTQLNRFFKKMASNPSKLNASHKKLAEQLISLHITDSPFSRIPHYDFNSLKKGIFCSESVLEKGILSGQCQTKLEKVKGKSFICSSCGKKESVETAVIRNVGEYMMLFPERKFTTTSIQEWCGYVVSQKIIRRILNKHLQVVKDGKVHYFEKRSEK